MRDYFVYILANAGLMLYIGVTNNLEVRLYQHAAGWSAYTSRYHIDRLLYFETTTSIEAAIAREKQLKTWRRDRMLALIRSVNPEFRDLREELLGEQAMVADSDVLRTSSRDRTESRTAR